MRRAALALCVVLAGCAGMDERSEQRCRNAHALLATEPARAIEELEPVLAAYPQNVEARRLHALALDATATPREAFEAWDLVVKLSGHQSGEQEAEAHRRRAALALRLLGDPPHKADSAARADQRLVAAARDSFEFLFDEAPDDLEIQCRVAECQYRAGEPAAALATLRKILAREPAEEMALWLDALVREQSAGAEPPILAVYFRLTRANNVEVRRLVACHLIFLADRDEIAAADHANICGVLVKMLRERSDPPAELVAWGGTFENSERKRLDERLYSKELTEIDALVAAGRHADAWIELERLPLTHPEIAAKRSQVAELWTRALLEEGNRFLADRNTVKAQAVRERIEQIPEGALSAGLLEERHAFHAAIGGVENMREAKTRLQRARDALRRHDHQEALNHLDGIDTIVADELRSEMWRLRAHAYLEWGDRKEALRAFDEAGTLREIADKRNYGVLLVEAGRTGEAIEYLELLPLSVMQGDVLDALIASLEKQGNWEKVLSRLAEMKPLPSRFEATRLKACSEAANRWLRIGNAPRALGVLRTHLDQKTLESRAMLEPYLRAALGAGDQEVSRRILGELSMASLAPLPDALILEGVVKLAGALGDQRRFDLLNRVARDSRFRELANQQMIELSPRFGSYLPEAQGSYRLRYLRIATDANNPIEGDPVSNVTARWHESFFRVEGDGGLSEDWWIADGVWHRRSDQGEILIPVRVDDPGNLPSLSYQHNKEEYHAEVVKYGIQAAVQNKFYNGCLQVRLSANNGSDETTYLYLAPDVGEVRREVFRGGARIEQRDLLSIERFGE